MMVMRAPGNRLSASGFTLLEVLMVVLVVGILSTVVMLGLNPGGAERHLNDEAERLASLLSLAASEAVMQNREYGLQLEGHGYRFLCMDSASQRWSPCTGDGLFKVHELPDGLEIRVLTASRMQLPEASGDQNKEEPPQGEDLQPDMLLLSSGEASPGELELRVVDEPSQRIKVKLDEIGRASWGEKADEEMDHAG